MWAGDARGCCNSAETGASGTDVGDWGYDEDAGDGTFDDDRDEIRALGHSLWDVLKCTRDGDLR